MPTGWNWLITSEEMIQGGLVTPTSSNDPRCGCRLLQPPARLGPQEVHATGGGQAQIFPLSQRLRRDALQPSHMQGSISTALVSSIDLNLVQMVHLNSAANS